MGQISNTTPPKWNKNTVATDRGWVDQTTKSKEVIVAARGLATNKAAASAIIDVKLFDIVSGTKATKAVYKSGDALTVRVRFNEAVAVTGSPIAALTIGGVSGKNATYLSGTGTGVLLFRYTVVNGDDGLIVLPAAITLNGGTIVDVVSAGQNAVLTIAATTLTQVVDSIRPTLTSVSLLSGPRYVTGTKIGFAALYSAPVTVVSGVTQPIINFDVNSVTKAASYVSGSGTNKLIFEYTVVAGDTATAGQVTNGSIVANNAITSANGNTVLRGNGGIATIAVTAGGTGYSTAPVVTITGTGTGATATATVAAGAVTAITVNTAGINYSLTGLTVSFGGPGTGATATITNNATAITVSAVVLNTGAADAAATLTISNLTSTYKLGDTLDVLANLSANQVVVGIPYVNVSLNGTVKSAKYLSGSGTSTLTFRYTVVEGDAAAATQVSIPSNSVVVPSGASIKNTSAVDAVITHSSPTTSAAVVDGVSPVISTFTKVGGPNYVTTDNLDFTVLFNKSVTVTGVPNIKIGIAANERLAVYTSGSGSNTLTFRYTVVAGDVATIPGKFVIIDNFITLNGGTILGTVSPNNAALSPLSFRRPTVVNTTFNA